MSAPAGGGLYPSLGDYMGLDLSPQAIEQQMPMVVSNPPEVGFGIICNACTVQAVTWLPPGLRLPASYVNWMQLKSQLTSLKIKACRKRP